MNSLDKLDLTDLPLPAMAFTLSVNSRRISDVVHENADDLSSRWVKVFLVCSSLVALGYLFASLVSANTFMPMWLCLILVAGAVFYASKLIAKAMLKVDPTRGRARVLRELNKHFTDDFERRFIALIIKQVFIEKHPDSIWFKDAHKQWLSVENQDLEFVAEILGHSPESWNLAAKRLYSLHFKRTSNLIDHPKSA